MADAQPHQHRHPVLTVLAFAPAILLLMSSFTRIVIVLLSFLRQAMEYSISEIRLYRCFLPDLSSWRPPDKVNEAALTLSRQQDRVSRFMADKSTKELGTFMLKVIMKEKDLALFMNIANLKRPEVEGPASQVIVPAFAISELKRAFQIGFPPLHTPSHDRYGQPAFFCRRG